MSVSDTTTQTATEDAPLVGVGEACGVCRFPVAEDQICGNIVYAVAERGTLPKFCGAPGQAELQARHNTPGSPDHKSELAGYPRKRLGMTAARAKELAEQQAAVLGIQHRAPSAPAAPAAPAEPAAAQPVSAPVTPAAPAEPVTEPEVEVSFAAQELAARAIPQVGQADLAKLAELLLAAGQVVGSLDERLTAIRTAAEKSVATRTQQEMRATRELGTAREKAARAESRVSEAERVAAEARDAQLRAEGQLTAAQARIESLEAQLATIDERHRAELDRVRVDEANRADTRIDRFVREQAATAQAAQAAPAAAERPKLTRHHERALAKIAAGELAMLSSQDEAGQTLGRELVDLTGNAVPTDLRKAVGQVVDLGLADYRYNDDPSQGAVRRVDYTPQGPRARVWLTERGVAALQQNAH